MDDSVWTLSSRSEIGDSPSSAVSRGMRPLVWVPQPGERLFQSVSTVNVQGNTLSVIPFSVDLQPGAAMVRKLPQPGHC